MRTEASLLALVLLVSSALGQNLEKIKKATSNNANKNNFDAIVSIHLGVCQGVSAL